MLKGKVSANENKLENVEDQEWEATEEISKEEIVDSVQESTSPNNYNDKSTDLPSRTNAKGNLDFTQDSRKRKLITWLNPKSPISEQYRTIRTNIQFSSVDEIRTVMVTSSGPSEGKSTTIANLAVVFAQLGKKVLLLDCDLRKPSIQYTFSVDNLFGTTNVLTKQKRLDEVVKGTDEENLYIVTSGPIPPNPSELIGSARMDDLMQDALSQFDMVLLDTPPILAVPDAQILSRKCDGSILVISSGKTEVEQAKRSVELLKNSNAHILGTVLNNKQMQNNSYYYYYGTDK